jgi:4-hydroxy-tetrahydrodipicolinate synthase
MILLKTPRYLQKASDQEVFDYFEAVSNAVNIPIMCYHIAINKPAPLIAELAERGYIQYIKECVGLPNRIEDLLSLTDKLGVCGCSDRQTFIGLAFASGCVHMYGMAVPELVTALMDLIDKGDLREAWKVWVTHQPLLETIEFARGSGEHSPNLYYALACRGLPVGRARRPRRLLTDTQKKNIKSILEQYDVETVSPVKEYW